MITDVDGVRVGHWTDEDAQTGCTVVLLPASCTASGEVRGGAPGTREFALLDPGRLVGEVNAVVLSGGSAFGLAACDGVVRWCEERGLGFPTAGGPVPIVVGMVLFDLTVGDGSVRPDADAGYAACVAASDSGLTLGRIGAGTGATVGKWRGRDRARPGGIGSTSVRDGDLVVGALVAVNAFGDLRGDDLRLPVRPQSSAFANTTLAVVATNATLDKQACRLVAESAHDGFARALDPVHTTVDGDAVVATATNTIEAPLETVRSLAAAAVDRAIRTALT